MSNLLDRVSGRIPVTIGGLVLASGTSRPPPLPAPARPAK